MEKKLLLQENEYSIWRYNGIPEDVLSIFAQTNWGSAGAVYERKNSNELIRLLKQPTLLTVQQGEEIQGTAVFCQTTPTVLGKPFRCFIIRYFAATPAIQGKKVIKYYAVKVMELVRDAEQEKTIYVGCIEKGNARSYRVVENAGYKTLGLLCVNAFSRFFPKAQSDISRVQTESEKTEVMNLLHQHYKKHVLVHFDYIFLRDNYFVIRERGEIVAGCQFHRVHWAINSMPGLMGKVIMNVLPNIPLINKLFNPKRFEFLAFEGIYFKPGHEKTLLRLFEGLLHQEKMNSALFWMAEDCPYRKTILDHGNSGLLHSFVKDSGVYIMTSYRNMNDDEIELLKSGPLYASAFDYI